MSSKKLGTLVIVVLKARHLKDSHTFYKQDPYALVRLGETGKKTNVDPKGGQHPVWDEELHLPVLELASGVDARTLSVAVYSKESKIDELIGEGKLDISATLVNGEFDDWIKLEQNGAYRGEVYLEMTYYSAGPPLARRASKLSPNDRLWRPHPTPPRETTTPYISPQRSPEIRPSSLSPGNSPRLQPASSPYLQPTSSPRLPPTSSPRLPPASSPRLPPASSPRLPPTSSPRLPPNSSPRLPPTSPFLQPTSPHLRSSSADLQFATPPSYPRQDETPLPVDPHVISTPSRQPYVNPTLKNIPFLDVGPPAPPPTSAPALHPIPSILRPRHVRSSPIPIPGRSDASLPPPKDDINDPNRKFQRELAESDAAYAARLAEREGIDVERLRVEEADAELARRLAEEDKESGKGDGREVLVPGGWVG